jgi:pimeloyl-ACP methyl ester carboxylesterase
MSRTTRHLTHVHVRLALHDLRPATGASRPLLLLHGLGEHTPAAPPPTVDRWDGAVHGLDLTGHGGSSRTHGGGFTCEALLADVDAALAVLGPSTLVGRGLGGYVALLVAGARPELVRGAVICDGPGLAGGGPAPQSPVVLPRPDPVAIAEDLSPVDPVIPDPYALLELARDPRPSDYVLTYLRQAVQFSELEVPVAVAAVTRPPWLAAVVEEPGVAVEPLDAALRRYAG